MIARLLAIIGNPTEVRTICAVVLGALITVLAPHDYVVVKAVVDGLVGVIVAVDVHGLHKTNQVETQASATLGVPITHAAPSLSEVAQAVSGAFRPPPQAAPPQAS